MTTILPPHDLAVFRSIAKTAAVLLVCLRIDEIYPGRAIADFEIADILEADPRTINKQMRSLSASGLMFEQRENKYVVTVLGRNTLMAYRNAATLSIEETKIYSETPELCAQNVLHDMNDDEAKNVLINESSSIMIERTKCVQYLEATHLLFGSAVSTTDIQDSKPEYALAWIAKAYADRKNPALKNPPGMVYAKLKKQERPPLNWLKDPTKGLPKEYLAEIGLWQETQFDDESDLDDDPKPICADETVNAQLNDGKSMSAAQAWQSVLGQLQLEMPRHSFDNFVRDTYPVHYEDNVIKIRSANSVVCAWLEDRLLSTVERLLVGILNQHVQVEFIVGY